MTQEMSLGEVQMLSQKAARGAGRAHGTAQDAGYAVRWLCERGFDGAGLLLDLLQATDGADTQRLTPGPGRDGPFCPLIVGAYLADLGQAGTDLPIHVPALMQPFIAPEIEATATRALVAEETLAALETFAARTYAPATEQSRASGAGAGLSDND